MRHRSSAWSVLHLEVVEAVVDRLFYDPRYLLVRVAESPCARHVRSVPARFHLDLSCCLLARIDPEQREHLRGRDGVGDGAEGGESINSGF